MIVKSGLPTYLSQQQVRQLFAVVTSVRDKALFSLIYFYGLRVSEAHALDRADLDLDRQKIPILRSKNGIPGEKPLFRSLVTPLRDYSPRAAITIRLSSLAAKAASEYVRSRLCSAATPH
jgi:integrase